MESRTARRRLPLWPALLTLAVLGAVAACGDDPGTTAPRQDARVRVEGDLVITPSGAVFTSAEWAGRQDKSPWLVPAATIVRRIEERQRSLRARAGQILLSVTGHSAPHVLCHESGPYVCDVLQTLIPGAAVTTWTDAEWGAATAEQFAAFDVIYVGDFAGSYAGLTGSRDRWGAATTGRIALTGVHFEHCFEGEGEHASEGPCTVLKASVEWIHAGVGTGLLMSTQVVAGALPTVAPYGDVTYLSHGNGYEIVRITRPEHAAMQGSTNASLSNFHQSSHSLFATTGSFSSVADVCDIPFTEQADEACTRGTWRPHFLVSTLDGNTTTHVIKDGDGDDVIRTADNHAALVVPDGALQAGTTVTLERVVTPRVPLPVLEGQQAYGPYFQIEVSPSQPLGPGITWALCVDADAATANRLRIAKETHDPTDAGIIIFPRVDPGTLVDCTEPTGAAAPSPARGGLGGSALRFASRAMSDALSVFAPTPAHAIHLGIGGRSDGSTLDDGFSLWGAVTTLYDVQGFFAPVTNPGFATPLAANSVRAGRAVPLKFRLGGDFGLDIFAPDSPTSVGYKCSESEAEPVEETVTANASGLQYDAATGQYTYVWKTEAGWAGTCRKITLTFTDGQRLSALFSFTR